MKIPRQSCDLCGLPLRYGNYTAAFNGEAYRFCCNGCKQVFNMLFEASDRKDPQSFKETDLFKKCREMGIIPASEAELEQIHLGQSASVSEPSSCILTNEEVDLDAPTDTAHLKLTLLVDGMWCPACSWVIVEGLKKDPGVLQAICSFPLDRVRCTYDPIQTSSDRITGIINGLGYRAHPPDEEETGDRRREFIRFAVSVFLTMNVMMLSFSLYSGFFTALSEDSIHKLSWPIAVMASIVLFYGGRNIYRKAWPGLRSPIFSMETLICAGAFSAYLYSTFNLFTGSIHLYYDTSSMLVTLFLAAKFLEGKGKRKIQEEVANLFVLRPKKVRICTDRDPRGRYVSIDQLIAGDNLRVVDGEIVPADGLIMEGTASVDESPLTGESLPRHKRAGDRIRSGSRLISGDLKVRAESVGEHSMLGQIIHIMEEALDKKGPFEGKIDVILQWFVPVIISLAFGTGLVCLSAGLSFERSLIRAVTVLVISCPCTLGIAVPLTRVAGISLARRNSLIVREFSSFERLRYIDTFVFDKTGTVTSGEWRLFRIVPFEPFSERDVLAMASGLEKESFHYIAAEIRRVAESTGVVNAELEGIRTFENGVSGNLRGKELKIGSSGFIGGEIVSLASLDDETLRGDGDEVSTVYMSCQERLCGVFLFGDAIRETSYRLLERIKEMGYHTALISGDGEPSSISVGKRMGIEESHGGMLPQDKAEFIARMQKQGHSVAMVGDGINDAPAMIQSDLALALHSGGALGEEAADISLMKGDLTQLLDFFGLAKRVNRKIFQNLTGSFLYNIIGIPVAMIGLLTPLIAVSAMFMSSLSVIGNTLLLIRKRP